MITNVTTNANYNNYNLGFKGVKDKLKSVAAKISTKIMPSPLEIMPTDATTKLAQRPTLRQELINQAMVAYALAPIRTILTDGQKAAKTAIEFLTIPDRLRSLINHYGYGEKFNELTSKLKFANDKESAVIKQEIRNLIDECANKNPAFEKAVKSIENIELKGAPELGINPRKVDILDDFLLWE